MISRNFRIVALATVGTILVAACGASVASNGDVPEAGSASASAKKVNLEDLGSELRAARPESINPPSSEGGLPPVLRSIKTDDKVVFITIDDGGTADPKVTEIIRKTGIPVTPFMTENVTRSNKAYFKEISEMTGQIVQNHTVDHPQMPTLSLAGQEKQLCQASKNYAEWFGANPWMVRPPYGEFNNTTREASKACGLSYVVLRNVSLPAAFLRYAQGDKLKPGDIILTHWRPDLYKHLPRALKDIKRQGFKVAALQDYLPAPV